MKFTIKGFIISWIVATAAIMAYNGTHALRPGYMMVIQHSNGEIEVEERPGYHFKTGTVAIVKKSLLIKADGSTPKRTPDSIIYDSPNKNLVRIK